MLIVRITADHNTFFGQALSWDKVGTKMGPNWDQVWTKCSAKEANVCVF